MERHGEEVDLTPTEASGGETSKKPHVRYVLIISLVLAVVVLTIVWVSGSLFSQSPDEESPVANVATPDAAAPEPIDQNMDAQGDVAPPTAE